MYLFDKPHKYSIRKSRPELDSDFHKLTNGWNLLLYAHTKRDHKSYGSAARLYGSWIYNYLCNQGLSHLHGELYSIQHYVIQFQLKVALNTITLTLGSKHSIEIATDNIIICYSVYNIYYTDAACALPAAIQNSQWNDETRRYYWHSVHLQWQDGQTMLVDMSWQIIIVYLIQTTYMFSSK